VFLLDCGFQNANCGRKEKASVIYNSTLVNGGGEMKGKLLRWALLSCICALIVAVHPSRAEATCYKPDGQDNLNNPPCEGNFDYDCDEDGTDAFTFKTDFGRSRILNACPPSGPAPVAKTGMLSSWLPYDDGSTQCGVVPPDPRFTDNNDGTVTDNLTGLIWLKNAGCLTKTQTCRQAMQECWFLNSGECGLTDGSIMGDWRLPTIKELLSLIEYGRVNPAIAPGGVVLNYHTEEAHCSSTPFANEPDYLWTVNLWWGYVDRMVSLHNFGALCVRPSASNPDYCCGTYPCPPPNTTTTTVATSTSTTTTVPVIDCEGTLSPLGRWCDQENGTIKDMTTELVWLKDAGWGGGRPWADCTTFNDAHIRAGTLYAGMSGAGLSDGSVLGDWRLPTINELVDITVGDEYIRHDQMYFFTNVQDWYYWSSTPNSPTAMLAVWVVHMDTGTAVVAGYFQTYNVWPVRNSY
jgi:hypothetical protein